MTITLRPGISQSYPKSILDKASKIKLLALDVDGVLTDGTLYLNDSGEEIKGFSILDGLGIKLLQNSGITVAIITGRRSEVVRRRAEDLGIKHIIQGREDKLVALNSLLADCQLNLGDAAYMGDDLPDLAAVINCHFGITVPNACHQLRECADWTTSAAGGKGAVREASELILSAQNKLDTALKGFYPN